MKKATKAALLSALVYPGVGQLLYQAYWRAFLLVAVFSVAVYYYVKEVVSKYQPLIDKVTSGEVGLNSQALAFEISKNPIILDPQLVSTLTYILITCWLVGIIDAYRSGIKKDANASS
ncbi:MAG: hypothetical protein HRT53_09960 [Colwellia sp.]|nr:hypothetical protein [Colwellia sp.]